MSNLISQDARDSIERLLTEAYDHARHDEHDLADLQAAIVFAINALEEYSVGPTAYTLVFSAEIKIDVSAEGDADRWSIDIEIDTLESAQDQDGAYVDTDDVPYGVREAAEDTIQDLS